MAAPTDQNGVLSAVIQQVSDGSPQYSQNASTYSAKFKGPYATLKDANRMVDLQLSAALLTIGLSISNEFSFPQPPSGTQWYVTGTNLEQTEAGDHAIMTVNCEARDSNLYPTSGVYNDPYHDVWNLRWEAYTVRPLAFCKNVPHQDLVITDTGVSEGEPIQPGEYACREHIDYFLNGSDKGTDRGHKWYRDDTGQARFLNEAEELICNKALQDKSALWHYPVLTHTTVQDHYISNVSSVISGNTTYSEVIGDKIDYIVGGSASPSEKPEGCPYTFPTTPRWIWVKTGDDMQHVKTKRSVQFQRTETFMGVISADLNYYGDVAFNHNNLSACRWEVGEL